MHCHLLVRVHLVLLLELCLLQFPLARGWIERAANNLTVIFIIFALSSFGESTFITSAAVFLTAIFLTWVCSG